MLASDGAFDSTLALMREGYTFIGARCDRLGTDAFATRLMLRRAVCLRGAEAARLLYDGDRFTRVGAVPRSALHLLQDVGSVNLLDDAAHRRRKRLFLDIFDQAGLARLVECFAREWRAALPRWAAARRVTLHDALYAVLTRAALRWAGIAADEATAAARAREFRAMVERAGSVGPANWAARLLRLRTERWARQRIAAARERPDDGGVVARIAHHRDADGAALAPTVAAVELINVLRPIAAVARFITFAALALHRHPEWRRRFAAGEEDDLEAFVQEVRRFYPFFPFVGGRARRAFEWRGIAFAPGAWALVDLYGTNHDPRLWPEPEEFRPERFRGWAGDPDSLVPQGAGNRADGHRCPGEPPTVALVEEAVRLLTRSTRYGVPAQDLTVDLGRVPALPRSRFVVHVEP